MRGNAIIAEAVLLLATLTAASLFSVAVISKMGALTSSFSTSIKNHEETIEASIRIVYVAPLNDTYITTWIKNTGSLPIPLNDELDIFLIGGSTYKRIPYGSASKPYWTSYSNEIIPKLTKRIDIFLDEPLVEGEIYVLKVVLYTGYEDDYYFSYRGG